MNESLFVSSHDPNPQSQTNHVEPTFESKQDEGANPSVSTNIAKGKVMANCTNCNLEVPQNASFCSSCGHDLSIPVNLPKPRTGWAYSKFSYLILMLGQIICLTYFLLIPLIMFNVISESTSLTLLCLIMFAVNNFVMFVVFERVK